MALRSGVVDLDGDVYEHPLKRAGVMSFHASIPST